MKKLATKLMISVLSVALAFIALGTSTFAWFSMNTTVEATGMQLTAVTPINLLINDASNETWANSVAQDEGFSGKMFPASSQNGTVFNAIVNSGNYINNGIGGVADANTTFQLTSDQADSDVIAMTGSADGYWAEYTYKLKLSEAQTTAAKVYLSTLKVYHVYEAKAGDKSDGNYYTYDAGVYTVVPNATDLTAGNTYYHLGGIDGAVRVALFVGDVNGSAATTAKGIYANAAESALAINDTVTAAKITAGTNKNLATNSVSAVVPTSENASLQFDVNGTAVNVKLVVWIEGQDSDCVNANAGQSFKIDCAFSVKENA